MVVKKNWRTAGGSPRETSLGILDEMESIFDSAGDDIATKRKICEVCESPAGHHAQNVPLDVISSSNLCRKCRSEWFLPSQVKFQSKHR